MVIRSGDCLRLFLSVRFERGQRISLFRRAQDCVSKDGVVWGLVGDLGCRCPGPFALFGFYYFDQGGGERKEKERADRKQFETGEIFSFP